MQNTVIILNTILAICCIWLAWRIWIFKNALKRWTQALILADITAHQVLSNAPASIMNGQMRLQDLNQCLEQLKPQMNQARSLLIITQQFRWIWKISHHPSIHQQQNH